MAETRRVRAGHPCLAEQREAAVLVGINVSQMHALAFGRSAALGAATGVIMSFLGAISPFMGFHRRAPLPPSSRPW
ncbi:hypothetical protein [Xanthobacter autotrophicus]|uniref:hypothetical protein n=1 Tax=Xanthobacter autotrophicus TaxID=280 RepID=UPI00372B1890